jgi:hypothetical protein
MTHHNEQAKPTPLLLSQTQAAHLLGDIHRTTLWRMVQRGDLQQVNIGRRAMITLDSVEFYVARLAGRAGDSCGNVRPLSHGGR